MQKSVIYLGSSKTLLQSGHVKIQVTETREMDTDKELPWAQVSLLSQFLKGRKSFSLSAFQTQLLKITVEQTDRSYPGCTNMLTR